MTQSIKKMGSELLVTWLTLSLVAQGAQAAGTILVDGTVTGVKPLVISAPNGVPLINIATPDNNNVSQNFFTEFNIDAQGAILNNSREHTQTALGGYVGANLQLSQQAANLILNEVTGASASDLNGYLEVAGQQAEVIIANENGITCNGCGFINTTETTLTTGDVSLDSQGRPQYQVNQGQLSVQGRGLNAANMAQLTLQGRHIKVDAPIHANALALIAGRNHIASDGTVTSSGASSDQISIDTAALGGMYANTIHMVSSDTGLGVNVAGTVIAQQGELVIDSNGQLTISGTTQAKTQVNLKSGQNMEVSGNVQSETSSLLDSDSNITISGSLTSLDILDIDATTLTQGGIISATAGIDIDTTGQTTLGGRIHSDTTIDVDATQITLTSGDVTATQTIDINASSGTLNSAATLRGGEDIQLSASGGLTLDAQVTAGQSLTLTGTSVSANGALASGVDFAVGKANRAYDLTINATQGIDINAGVVAGQDLTIANTNTGIDVTAQTLRAGRDLKLESSGAIVHTSANSSAGEAVTLVASQLTANASSEIRAYGEGLTITAATVGTGALEAGKTLTLNLGNDYTHTDQNRLTSNEGITLNVSGNFTNQSTLASAGTVSVNAQDLVNNSSKRIAAATTLNLTATGDVTNNGTIEADDMNLGAANLTNNDSIIGDRLTINLSNNLTQDGANKVIGATEDITIRLDGTLTNAHGGLIYSDEDLVIKGNTGVRAVKLVNDSATIESVGNLNIDATTVWNVRDEPLYDLEVTVPVNRTNESRTPASGFYYETWTYTTTDYNYRGILSEEDEGVIRSGGGIALNTSDIKNEYSLISAKDTLQIASVNFSGDVGSAPSGVTLVNTAANISSSAVTVGTKLQKSGTRCSSYEICGTGYKNITNHNSNFGSTVTRDGVVVDSIIRGGNVQVINAKNVSNTTVGASTSANFTPATDVLANISVPDNALFRYQTTPTQGYLIESNARFTDRETFLGSDYLLQGVNAVISGASVRLGDGFYEARLVAQQISALTAGSQFLEGYPTKAEQYKGLMDNAIAHATHLNLRPGVSLSKTQIAQLSQPIVWPVEQLITAPDGSQQMALVPVVYLHDISDGVLLSNGALIIGDTVSIAATGDINNINGAIVARQSLNLDAGGDITNLAGSIAGTDISLNAVGNVSNLARVDSYGVTGAQQDLLAGRGRIVAANALTIDAGNSVTDQAGVLQAGGNLSIAAGNNVNLESVALTQSVTGVFSQSRTEQQLAQIKSGGDLTISAGTDLLAQGTQFESDGNLSLAAGNNLTLAAVQNETNQKDNSRSFFGRNKSTSRSRTEQQLAQVKSGGDLTISAGTDLLAEGTQFESDGNLSLAAGNNLTIEAVHDVTSDSRNYGLTNSSTAQTTSLKSTGNVSLQAGDDLLVRGADIQAGQALALNADNIRLTTAENRSSSRFNSRYKQTEVRDLKHDGVNLQAGTDLSLNALKDLEATGASAHAGNNIALNAGGDITISAAQDESYRYAKTVKKKSWGRKKTTLNESFTTTNVGGELSAGNNLTINSRINSDNSVTANTHSGDVLLHGVKISAQNQVAIAGDDVTIAAKKEISFSRQEITKRGFLGLNKKNTGKLNREELVRASEIDTKQQNLDLLAASDIAIVGSTLSSGEDINLSAVDDIIVTADQALSQAQQWSKETKFLSSLSSIYESEDKVSGSTTSTAVASRVNAAGNLIIDAGRAHVVGSDISAGNNLNVTTDIGDIVVESAQSSTQSYSNETVVKVDIIDVLEQVADVRALTDALGDGQAKISITKATYDKVDTQTTATNHRASQLVAKNDITLNSVGDIAITGSDIIANADNSQQGNANLIAGGDIRIKETVDVSDTTTDEVHGKGELSVVVQNQAVEVSKAVIAVKEANKQVKTANEDYRKYQKDLELLKQQRDQLQTDYNNKEAGLLYEDIVELNSLIGEVESDQQWYQAGIALAAVNLTSKSTLLLQQVAALPASVAATLGFNAGLQIDLEASKTETDTHTEISRGSAIVGNNITLQTGNNNDISQTATQITGSGLYASEDININTGELTVEASRDENSANTNTEQASIRIAQTVYGIAAGGPTISGDYSRSKANNNDTTYNNSTLNADNISLSSTGDTAIKGANIKAEDTLALNVGEDLHVQSQQNRSSANNKSAGISAGFSLGAGGTGDSKTLSGAVKNIGTTNGKVSSVSGGLNASSGRTRSRQTVLTDLTGETVNINVGNNTALIGATVAAKDADGNDSGQLSLTTKTLDFADLSNTTNDSQRSAGISASVGIADKPLTDKQQAAQASDPTKNQATDAKGEKDHKLNTPHIAYSNNSSYSKDKTLATLGEGAVTVTDDAVTGDDSTERLNRDTGSTTKELYAIDRQQGNVDLTIDTRFFTKTGREEIFRQTKELPTNLEKVAVSILVNLEQLTDSSQVRSPAEIEALQNQIRADLETLSPEEKSEVMQAVGIFMDGTGHDRSKDLPKGTETNVAILRGLYDEEKGKAFYFPGVGTHPLTAILCGGTGCGGKNRINDALEKIQSNWDGESIINLDIFGYSRGSAQALELQNHILTKGIPGVPEEKVFINALFLFDTVASIGLAGNNVDWGYNLSAAPGVKIYHATANDEHRRMYDLQSQRYADGTVSPDVIEIGFTGEHGNIGGGDRTSSLWTLPLQWMHDNALEVGVPLAPRPEQYQVPLELQILFDKARAGNSDAQIELNGYIDDNPSLLEKLFGKEIRDIYFPSDTNNP